MGNVLIDGIEMIFQGDAKVHRRMAVHLKGEPAACSGRLALAQMRCERHAGEEFFFCGLPAGAADGD